jgi:hypothetical protein
MGAAAHTYATDVETTASVLPTGAAAPGAHRCHIPLQGMWCLIFCIVLLGNLCSSSSPSARVADRFWPRGQDLCGDEPRQADSKGGKAAARRLGGVDARGEGDRVVDAQEVAKTTTSNESPSADQSVHSAPHRGIEHRRAGHGSAVKLGERRPKTTLAGPEHRSLPLHAVPVPALNEARVLAAMLPDAVERYHKHRRFLSVRSSVTLAGHRSALWHEDAALLVDTGLAELATVEPTVHLCSAFTVVEEGRRRNITWSKDGNDAAYEAGFVSEAPLQHSSYYADAAVFDCGIQFDLRAGFYQLELTAAERPFFRFKDTEGKLYQMTRLPMGHSAAVDLMQLVTMTIAGDHSVSKPEFRCPHRSPDVYVDGARFAGTGPQAEEVGRLWRKSADFFGATFKDVPMVQTKYDFVGIHFDHKRHTVRLADKTAKKIPFSIPNTTTIAELQALVGRLLFGAGVTRTPLGDYYFALKACRRHFNRVNGGEVSRHTQVELTKGCAAKLQQLRAQVLQTAVIRSVQGTSSMKLFTDASKIGWGAVLMTDRGRVLVTGERWSHADKHLEISVLEMKAVQLGVTAFTRELQSAAQVALLVDNTSVKGAVERGTCRSADLVVALAAAIPGLRELPGRVSVGYVGSKENPADPPSRMDSGKSYAEASRLAHAHKTRGNDSGLRWCLATGVKAKVRDLALWERSWTEDESLIQSSIPLRQSVQGRDRSNVRTSAAHRVMPAQAGGHSRA